MFLRHHQVMATVVKQTKVSAAVFKNLKLVHEFMYKNDVKFVKLNNMFGYRFKNCFSQFLADDLCFIVDEQNWF